MMFYRRGKLDMAEWRLLREANQPGFYEELPIEATASQFEPSPHLAPAGAAPEISPEETDYRPRV